MILFVLLLFFSVVRALKCANASCILSHSMHALEHFTHLIPLFRSFCLAQAELSTTSKAYCTTPTRLLPFSTFFFLIFLSRSAFCRFSPSHEHKPNRRLSNSKIIMLKSTDYLMNNTREKKNEKKSTYSFNRLIKFYFLCLWRCACVCVVLVPCQRFVVH